MPEPSQAADKVATREVVYDGEEYSRESLQNLVSQYQDKQKGDLEELERLQKVHDDIAQEMARDVMEQKSAWECLRGMVTLDMSRVGANFRDLLERIPVVHSVVPDRPLAELLREKVHVAEVRTREIGHFLDEVDARVGALREDVTRLRRKTVVAAQNGEKAARVILELQKDQQSLAAELESTPADQNARRRELEVRIDELKQQIWEHGGRLRLYKNAEDRIAAIVSMNNNFLQMLTNLHSNMTILFESGQEILDELRGNLTGLATATQASELTLDMQKSMDSLKVSVNKVATLASQTSLFLTQNVERLTSQMKIYDEATRKLVESNLAAEQEIQEKRIDETLKLAHEEFELARQAREGAPEPAGDGKGEDASSNVPG